MNKPNLHRVKQKVEQTATGPVEYEAIECDECGYVVPLESVVIPVFPDEIEKKWGFDHNEYFKFEANSDVTVRVYCEDCARHKFDDSVIDKPLHREFIDFAFEKEWRALLTLIFAVYCFWSGLIVAMSGFIVAILALSGILGM